MKKENTSSIVKRINTRMQLAALWKLLITDAAIIVSGIFCWCIASEAAFGRVNMFQQRVFFEGEWLKDLSYSFTPAGGAETVINIGRPLVIFLCVIGVLLIVQLAGWFEGWRRNEYYLRNVLRPIDEVAIAADRIASFGMDKAQPENAPAAAADNKKNDASPGIDAGKLQSMENAINSIHGSEEGIHIGDRDLQGLEDSINNLLERLRASSEEQIRFVDDASHELRTPISVINGYASMLCRWGKDDPKTLDEGLHAILEESGHMQTLVEQLLFLARGDGGRQQLRFTRIQPRALMEEIREESTLIDEKHLYALDGNGPEINADEAMMKQAIRILVDNAAKYTPEGEKITLSIETEGDDVILCVKDHGIGLDAGEAAHMFERFFRGEGVRGSTKGSGLGLSIASWIVRRHGGTIDAVGYKDVGTKVSIRLKKA